MMVKTDRWQDPKSAVNRPVGTAARGLLDWASEGGAGHALTVSNTIPQVESPTKQKGTS